jgi:oligopeptide transport system ATP-binding protein
MAKILDIQNLKVHFLVKQNLFSKPKIVYAVDDITFEVYQGETLGIVGESGCGKSSLARSLVGLNSITAGSVIFQGQDNLAKITKQRWHELRQDIQFIFQDPVASLNPRMTVSEIIAEPLKVYFPKLKKLEVQEKVLHLMHLVGLSPEQMNRYPVELSGGQCQRIGIARALILNPKLIICDESVSALDVSIKAQIINLLKQLQQKLNLTIIFISHDLSIIKHLCNRVLVMYLGKLMELGNQETLYTKPHHPYTQALLAAIPIITPQIARSQPIQLLQGELPSPITPPQGCVLSSRCPLADAKCKASRPQPRYLADGTRVACFKA